MLRSVMAVVAGIVTLSLTSFGIEGLLEPVVDRATVQSSALAMSFMFVYSAICVAIGGYVTAWLARCKRMRHTLVMGAIQTALVIPAMISFPNEAPHETPLWRWLVGMTMIVPAAWCGAKLYMRRFDGRTA
jgi:hypothetical protein